MKTSQDHTGTAATVPVSQFVSPCRKGQVNRDPHDPGKRLPGRWALQQVLVPVPHLPLGRGCSGNARQRQRWREHMLAKACVRVLGIERVDQQRVVLSRRLRRGFRLQPRGRLHFLRNPKRLHRRSTLCHARAKQSIKEPRKNSQLCKTKQKQQEPLCTAKYDMSRTFPERRSERHAKLG